MHAGHRYIHTHQSDLGATRSHAINCLCAEHALHNRTCALQAQCVGYHTYSISKHERPQRPGHNFLSEHGAMLRERQRCIAFRSSQKAKQARSLKLPALLTSQSHHDNLRSLFDVQKHVNDCCSSAAQRNAAAVNRLWLCSAL